MTQENPQYKMRLICQFSIPCDDASEAKLHYSDIKTYLRGYSPDFTIAGQINMVLEPCCNKRKEPENVQKNPQGP